MNKNLQPNQITETEWAQFKRMTELYSADPVVRKRILQQPQDVIEEWGFQLEPQLCKEAILMQYQQNMDSAGRQENPYYQEFMRRFCHISEYVVKNHMPESFTDSRMWIYNQTVTNRLRMENHYLRGHTNIRYYPVNFELSEGCRVQCCFCGLSAPVWKCDFPYTDANRIFWREVLHTVKEVVGPVSSTGICYFATEPLDNPDYEKFLMDFFEIMGDYPQTTTAVSERYPQRIRSLIGQIGSERMKHAAIRFSVRTLTQFYRILKEYTPEELADIELIMNNVESNCVYAVSGRVRENREHFPAHKLNHIHSISCVAGYKINMVKKTVTFMEPERPDDTYPNGIREYEVCTFSDAEELRSRMQEMGRRWIQGELPMDLPLRWNPHITVQQNGNIVSFTGDQVQCKISGNVHFLKSISLIEEEKTFQEICRTLGIGELVAEPLRKKLGYLYQKGYLRWKV